METLHRQEHDTTKQRRIRIIILVCLVLVAFLGFLETKVFQLGVVPFPVSGNVLVFVLINFNILLLLLIVFLVLRNLVQLVFERKRKILGTKLRTKLVISFVSLSLIPTALLFFISLQFVSTSMDYWFNINVEQSLVESLDIAREVYKNERNEVQRLGNTTAGQLESKRYKKLTDNYLDLFLADILESHGLARLEIISPQRVSKVQVISSEIEDIAGDLTVPADQLRLVLEGAEDLVFIQSITGGELVQALTPVVIGIGKENPHVLVTSRLIPQEKLERMALITSGLEGYRQLMLLKQPIKTSFLVMLLIVTLLIVFCAIWFGFYVARGLAVPIAKLAEATGRVADGELDFVVEKDSGDEMGTLVDSFNKMTRDLLTSREELNYSNLELDNRRRYTEIILQNVPAGVISLDADGRIVTVNRFAVDLLHIDTASVLNQDYRKILHREHRAVLDNFYIALEKSGKTSIELPLRLTVGDESFSLRVNMTRLVDDEGNELGVVLVFDNLTELEKAQRMAAWREVARRIAHEVKNPLTPIQLSAQRLRKRYLDTLAEEGEVFDICTKTIINQVDELKRLVTEFSSFARMPAVQKAVNNFEEMAKDAMVLYTEGNKGIDFTLACSDAVPLFSFDLKQIKRVLINLLDNAVGSVSEKGGKGRIDVLISLDEEQKHVLLEVRDNGLGVNDDDKHHLFEPYFSRKKTGTGLGLAIASTIISDHGGYIRVKDNEPEGARFIVELPLVYS
ncbi:MAG: HAMP domain-containing protein [Desulfobulbaceae bacterium]|uniref:histidine kinase n=1 Tax=Candidatus Desulfobia pelagia TaxID=2841692 RepID=A0A8J6NAJ0_9BACT|nr:HAMP domain-containing protein [Candidatus Desulfobia pelagia]